MLGFGEAKALDFRELARGHREVNPQIQYHVFSEMREGDNGFIKSIQRGLPGGGEDVVDT